MNYTVKTVSSEKNKNNLYNTRCLVSRYRNKDGKSKLKEKAKKIYYIYICVCVCIIIYNCLLVKSITERKEQCLCVVLANVGN